MEADPKERKCTVITKESVFYTPEDSKLPHSPQTRSRQPSPSISFTNQRKSLDEKTKPKLQLQIFDNLLLLAILMVVLLTVILAVLMLEYKETYQMNCIFCGIGILFGLSLGLAISGRRRSP